MIRAKYTIVTRLLSLVKSVMKGYHVYKDNFFTSISHIYILQGFISLALFEGTEKDFLTV